MSNEILNPAMTYPVSAALAAAIVAGTTKKYAGVILNASGQLDLPGAGAQIFGVLYSADVTVVGQRARVQGVGSGKVFIRAGGTINPGDDLKVDTSGNFIAVVAGDIAAGKKVATCSEAGSTGSIASGQLCGGSASTVAVGSELVASGALSLLTDESLISITNTQAYSLADGRFVGQKKRIEVTAVSGTPIGTLTIATPASGEQAVQDMRAVGLVMEFEWGVIGGTGWHIMSKRRAGKRTFVLGTDSLANNTAKGIDISVTGTQSAALPNGQVAGEIIHISCSTAATLPAGTLTGTFKDKTGVAKTVSISAIDATSDYGWFEWDGSAWNEIASAGLTFN